MLSQRRSRPLVETLEDRLTPSGVSYFYDGSNLTVTGQTISPTVTLTETAPNTVSIQFGAAPAKTFSVTGNLTVRLQEVLPANSLTIAYNLAGNNANGAVSITASAFGAATTTAVNVTGTGATIGGPLTIGVLNPNADTVSVNGITVGGIQITDILGKGTVSIATTASVTDNGNLFISNANTVTLDPIGAPPGGPAVTVQGLASISTRNIAGVANAVAIGSNSSIQGSLIFTGAGNNTVTLGGLVFGNLIAQLGTGTNVLNVAAGAAIAGNTTVIGGSGGNTVTAALGSTFGGSFNAVLGNGTNVLTFGGLIAGPSFSYFGGNGTDSVTYAADTGSAARLSVSLGNGNDTFTLGSNNDAGGFIDGGFGTDTFLQTVAVINPPLTIINFEL